MIDIVDNLHEFWYSNNWNFFIRICENDFVKYRDESSIIFFDIVKYFCEKNLCDLNHAFHCDQIIFFDRDKR
jgi:hypothetical protein